MKILYLGLNFESFDQKEKAFHYPIIKIVPRSKSYIEKLLSGQVFTHYIFTSKRAVDIFCDYLLKPKQLHLLKNRNIIAIGKATQESLKSYNLDSVIPKTFTQEGIVELLKIIHLENSYFLIPRSSLARKEIDKFFKAKKINYLPLDIYDTYINYDLKKIDLNDFEEVFFTSPSTVSAFTKVFKKIPSHLKFKSIGPVTEIAIEKYLL